MYIFESKYLTLRKPNFLVISEQDKDFFNCSKYKILPVDIPSIENKGIEAIKEFYKELLQDVDERGLYSLEMPLLGNFNEEVFSLLSDFLENHEMSIGLYVSSVEEISNHKDIIDKYKIFVSSSDGKATFPLKKIRKQKSSRDYGIKMCCCKAIPDSVPNGAIPGFDDSNTFKKKITHYLITCKKSNPQIYKDGGITKQVFSKIISNNDYMPKKETILCLIIGMELNEDKAIDLLKSAGYALSEYVALDYIVMNHIRDGDYDIMSINEELDKYNLPILGTKA